MTIIKRTHCQVCNKELKNLSLNLGNHPLCDDLKRLDPKKFVMNIYSNFFM